VIHLSAQYQDRTAAGKVLGELLQMQNFKEYPLILAIPNGGLAVGLPMAEMLNGDLDLLLVRKLQIPFNPEAGFGAITSLGTVILNQSLVNRIGITDQEIQRVVQATHTQIKYRKAAYQGLIDCYSPKGRIVLIVDDGLASGYTMLAAIQSVKQFSPKKTIVAVPTASVSAVSKIQGVVDDFICPHIDAGFVFAVANAYHDWYDVPEEEVIKQLQEFRKKQMKYT